MDEIFIFFFFLRKDRVSFAQFLLVVSIYWLIDKLILLIFFFLAPYVQLDMNPTLPGVGESAVHKDAMFFSVHKFIGGIQTSGVDSQEKII